MYPLEPSYISCLATDIDVVECSCIHWFFACTLTRYRVWSLLRARKKSMYLVDFWRSNHLGLDEKIFLDLCIFSIELNANRWNESLKNRDFFGKGPANNPKSKKIVNFIIILVAMTFKKKIPKSRCFSHPVYVYIIYIYILKLQFAAYGQFVLVLE